MSRRASDKVQNRLGIALVILATLSSALASVVSYQALAAMNKFSATMDAVSRVVTPKSLMPEGY